MDIEKIKALRAQLHCIAERSMQEVQTKKFLMNWIADNTGLEVVDRGDWFFAFHKGTKGIKHIALRADYDAVVCNDGCVRHLCGHDGHAATLAGLALEISTLEHELDVYLIFQPGEEIGSGALVCSDLIQEKQITEVYGFHNIPGYPIGEVLLLPGTFACASTGMEIVVHGAASHAAYPENGKNPADLIASAILYLKQLLARPHKGVVLGTVIGVDLGSEAYGMSADHAVLRLTLRAEYQEEYDELLESIKCFVTNGANDQSMECRIQLIEEFPATINHSASIHKLEHIANELKLHITKPEEPFRWSEDFGYYLQKTEGAFFGVGVGEDHPALHTDNYEFEDEILETVICIYKQIVLSTEV